MGETQNDQPGVIGVDLRGALDAERALRDKLIRIGAKVVRHARRVVFQLAEVAIPRPLFAAILRRIERLRLLTPGIPAPT